MKLEIGDWVQALGKVVEEGMFVPGDLWTHAEPGAIGHIVGLEPWPDGTLMPSVYWEHTGTETLVDPDLLKRLCDHSGRPVDFSFEARWSAEQGVYIGSCQEFPSLGYASDIEDEALEGIRRLVGTVAPRLAASTAN